MNPATLIRGGLIWLMLVGLVLRVASAVLTQRILDDALGSIELLQVLGIGRSLAYFAGWAVVLWGLAWLVRLTEENRGLKLALGLFAAALLLDLAYIPLPWVLDGDALMIAMTWMNRGSSGLAIGGAVAALVHARDSGAPGPQLGLGIAGTAVFALLVLGMEQIPLEGPRWLPHVLGTLATVGLYGGLAVLPWAAEGEPAPSAPQDAVDPTMDFVVGGLFFTGGLFVTLLTVVGGGIEGRMILAWGPMLYGGFRLVRGLTRWF